MQIWRLITPQKQTIRLEIVVQYNTSVFPQCFCSYERVASGLSRNSYMSALLSCSRPDNDSWQRWEVSCTTCCDVRVYPCTVYSFLRLVKPSHDCIEFLPVITSPPRTPYLIGLSPLAHSTFHVFMPIVRRMAFRCSVPVKPSPRHGNWCPFATE